jgi:hypothetical protein
VDARLAEQQAEIARQRAGIAEVLETGAPLDVVPEFAALLTARDGKVYTDAEEDERDKMRFEMVSVLGTERDRRRVRDVMRLQAELAEDDPFAIRWRDLDARFADLGPHTPADAQAALTAEQTDFATELYRRLGNHVPGEASVARHEALYNEEQARLIRAVMVEVRRRLGVTDT